MVDRYAKAALLGLLLTAAGGCLGDERCDDGQRLEEGRCLPDYQDQGPDRGLPADVGAPDGGAEGGAEAGAGACAFSPRAEQLLGAFTQTGAVEQSDCVAPLPTPGFAVAGEVSFSQGDGGALLAAMKIVVDIVGTAAVAQDGTVVVSAAGSLLDISFEAEERLCFADADHAAGSAAIKLANPTGPLCEFELPVTLTRK